VHSEKVMRKKSHLVCPENLRHSSKGYTLLSLFFLITFAPLTYAGLIGVYEFPSKDMQITLEFKDEENIRIQVEEDFYLLINGTMVYMVNGENITDVKAFSERVRSWRITKFLQKRAQKRMQKMPTKKTISITDRTETLGGITGAVWESRIIDPETQLEEIKEIVVTGDSRMVRLKLAMQHISRSHESKQTPENIKKMRSKIESAFGDNVAILRYDNRFRLKSIKEIDLDPKIFLLPHKMEIKSMPSFSDLTNILQLVASLSTD